MAGKQEKVGSPCTYPGIWQLNVIFVPPKPVAFGASLNVSNCKPRTEIPSARANH